MPNWTKEQQEAIDREGCNIIVSAGAGSGKTAVLTARVIRKLKSGVNVNEILVLTFTNAAAFEMKERIRKAIKKEESLKGQLDLIDSAYITTFDSFSLAIVKKYHYLLNIPKDVGIIDNSIIYNEKVQALEEIMDSCYKEKNPNFLKLIGDFCTKDDSEIKKYILKINDKMDLLMDKEEYLDKYIATYFNESFIAEQIEEYKKNVRVRFEKIKQMTNDLLSIAENKLAEKLLTIVSKMNDANSYEDMYEIIDSGLPKLPPKSEDEVKILKAKIGEEIEDLQKMMEFASCLEMKEAIGKTREYAIIIVDIIKKLDQKISAFKRKNNLYEFNDIAKMAIKIVRDNQNVRESLKYFFKEIMIDEYQDTSYLQESFIKLIANDDVYMVGDIKQSIYRFRHADPHIFKNKYDSYAKGIGGAKIDLLKNFRSRKEVLDNINLIFDAIMDNEIGGAQYQESHRMVFGNTTYIEEGATNQNYNMEIYNYTFDKNLGFTRDEVEIFMIVKDIKEKVESHFQVFDKDKQLLRDITYSDFCILIDRASRFDLYKKIFEYFNVPLTKYTATNIKKDDDVALIKNIVGLLVNIKEKDYGIDFKYNFMSIGRSYLLRYSDQELFDYLDLNTYFDSDLYKKLLEISKCDSYLSLAKIIELIIDEFDFYMKSITVGEIEKVNVRLEYIINLAMGMEKQGAGIKEFHDYLEKIIASDIKMECEISENISDSVKIMTIHKSKGLEYHICYFAGLNNEFNISDVEERFIFSDKYGIICPYFDEGIGSTIYKSLYRQEYLNEEISEKIRLFYVALTRCKEKMIFISSLSPEEIAFKDGVVESDERKKYKSFQDIMNSISPLLSDYVKEIDLQTLGLTHDYNLIRKTNYQDKIAISAEKIENITLENNSVVEKSEHFSKGTMEVFGKETREKLNFGTEIHEIFELLDFKKPDLTLVETKFRHYVEQFLNYGWDFKNSKIYKEYEFLYQDDDVLKHGIIDLMLEKDDKITIIDYKTKNIDDDNYLNQLKGYKEYIRKKTNKTVEIYLYSIILGNAKKIEEF